MTKYRGRGEKNVRPSEKNARRQHTEFRHQDADFSAPIREKVDNTPLTAKTPGQQRYLTAIKSKTVIFATGPAGVGKTYISAAYAAQLLRDGEIERIYITRPAVEAGEKLGFLPGELNEKFDPYLEPFRDVLNERLGKSYVDYLMRPGIERVVAAPLAYMRGRTFKNAFVILDEAQNTTPTQMKMFLTRIGENCTVVVNGDISQKDIPGISGLQDAVDKVAWVPGISHIHFDRGDVVRSGIVQEILEAYDSPLPKTV